MSNSVWPQRRQPTRLPVPGILQARTLEWVAISFSSAWKWKVKVKSLSHVWLFATPWTAAYQVPPSMGFSRQEYWSGLPLPSPIYMCVFNKYIGKYFWYLWQIEKNSRWTAYPRNITKKQENWVCHEHIKYMCVHGCSVVSDSLQPHRLQATRLLCARNFLGKNTGVGCHFLLHNYM